MAALEAAAVAATKTAHRIPVCLRVSCGALSVCMGSLRAPAELAAAVPAPHQLFVPLQHPMDCKMACLPLPIPAEPPFPPPMPPSCVASLLWHVGAPLWHPIGAELVRDGPCGIALAGQGHPWQAFCVLVASPQARASWKCRHSWKRRRRQQPAGSVAAGNTHNQRPASQGAAAERAATRGISSCA